MKTLNLILLGLFCGLFATAKTGGDFTESDLKIIGSKNDGIMQILTVDGKGIDSVKLRLHSLWFTGKEAMKSEAFKTLCDRMMQTVLDPTNPGVGIAAPQVGLHYRLIIVQRMDKDGQPFEIYVNPEIVSSEGSAVGMEGCLSVPGRTGEVARATSIEIEYTDINTFKQKKEKIEGFTAIIFQHEIDHLEGVLYIDKLVPEAGLREISGDTEGICPSDMKIILKGNIVQDVIFKGGCNGNGKGIAALVKGKHIDEVAPILKGITCGKKDSSCPDRLARALEENKQ